MGRKIRYTLVVALLLTTITAAPAWAASVSVDAPPVGEVGEEIEITYTISGLSQPVATWSIDWGDGNTGGAFGTAGTFTDTHTYDNPGTYTITVTVEGASAADSIFIDGAPTVFDGTFWDDDGSIFEEDIEWLAAEGITFGCNPPTNDQFCPDATVSRAQMAAFLVRAFGYTDQGTADFTDTNGSLFEADINKLATAGVTKGCDPPTNDKFCPSTTVTRGQMAAFLVRAFDYTDAGTTDFTDTDGLIFEGDINKLATAGVTKGCNPPTNDKFCPNGAVTRGQMAAFLRRAFEG